MKEAATSSTAWIVGRDLELAALDEFLGADRSPAAFVLTGGPGIGKTTLWEAGIDAARKRRLRVLAARPSGAETQLSFAGLIDLLDGVDLGALPGLPAPQLRALEVALLRKDPRGVPPEQHAIAVGFLNSLRALAAAEPLLVAIDDIQWLDSPSMEALTFAARRLQDEGVKILLAKRPAGSSALEKAVERQGLRRLEVGSLSLGAMRRLLSERLGLSLPRRVLQRVFHTAQGNPLFALELGRTLAERGLPEMGEELPMPEVIEDLFGMRVVGLPGSLRKLVLAVALNADLRVSNLEAIADEGAVEEAVDAGLLLVDGGRVRPSHPLLAAAARSNSRARERRDLHLELARAVADEGLAARHLALATEHPDDELASTVASAAAGASARGAVDEAVELAEHALRLTAAESPERSERVLALARYLSVAGSAQRVTELLTAELGSLPAGAPRGRAHLMLAEAGLVKDLDEYEEHLELALAHSGDDPALHATVLAEKWVQVAVPRVERIREAEAAMLDALPAARQAGPETERLVLTQLAWVRILRGRPLGDLGEPPQAEPAIYRSIARVPAIRLNWRGDVVEARSAFTRLLSLADERGEATSYVVVLKHLCELELRAGEWMAASRVLDEWEQSPDSAFVLGPHHERCRALHAAGRGLPEEAERWAARAVEGAETTGMRWDLLEALRARGIAALVAHEPARAVESLGAVWAHTQREGVEEPGAFPVAPDLVEALVESGELDEALAVTDRLSDLAEQQEHPWGLASAKRCRALVQLASATYDADAAASLEEAAAAYGRLGLRFDRARSLLALGRAQRRHRKWAAARRSLEQAAAALDELGSPGWAEQARSELARVGARRPQPAGELTPAERRVVELAAQGLSNKEIARTLVVSVHTVEVHLSHAYAKLGIRSRAQLAGRLKV